MLIRKGIEGDRDEKIQWHRHRHYFSLKSLCSISGCDLRKTRRQSKHKLKHKINVIMLLTGILPINWKEDLFQVTSMDLRL